jgi:hypothetical protein
LEFESGAISRCPFQSFVSPDSYRDRHKRIFTTIGARAVVFQRNIRKSRNKRQKKKIQHLFANNKSIKPRLCVLIRLRIKQEKQAKQNLRALAPLWQKHPKQAKIKKVTQTTKKL